MPDHRARRPSAESERARILVDQAGAIQFTADAEGRPDFLSGGFFSYTGLKPSARLPQAWERSIHPEDLAPYRAAWRGAKRSAEAFELLLRLRGADGSYRAFRLTCRPVRTPAGARCVWAGHGVDATELIEARAAAERALKAKTRALATAGHDLRQPFQAMRLFLHILERRPLDADARKLAGSLTESLRSGEDLLNALVELAAVESGTLTPYPAAFGLAQLLRRVAADHAAPAAAKGLDLRCLPCRVTVRSDPAIVERILRHLLGNALRFTERGKVLVGCRRRGGRVRVEVRDTGPGIPDGELRAIFEEFHQVAQPGRDRYQGLGLGLTISDRLAALLGTRVTASSRLGYGSVFSLDVPIVAASHAVDSGDAVEDRFAGVRVLLLEDDPGQRVLLEHMLAQWGAEVFTAGSLDEARSLIAQGGPQPDLVIAERHLSGRSGAEVVRALRHTLDRALPAVLLAGEAEEKGRSRSGRQGRQRLRRPLDPDRLADSIAAAISNG